MAVEPSQLNTWSHFQNQAPAVFAANHPRLDAMLRAARRLAQFASPALLNVGVGDGYLELRAYELGWQVYSLDPDAKAIARLGSAGIRATAGVLEAAPFADGQFDFVITSEVLEHLDDTQRKLGLLELARILKPGGYLIGSVPYCENLQMNVDVCPKCQHVFHRWGHTRSFDLSEVREMLAAHWQVIACRRTTFVSFRGRDWRTKFENLARWIAGKLGLGSPSIFFIAQKL
ncbi:MAG TPA: class I SAM-dependent methyltransferase [Pirellulales bacterium]|jgi:SAM-dependent methyltransferase|nr:class I SAM-dependent methyltransferase [Pirellulales bacterium]